MRQLNGPLRVIVLLLLASYHSAVAQHDCPLPDDETQFGEAIVRYFDTVQSALVWKMKNMCSSVRGNHTILARYNCTASSDHCEGPIRETVFDASYDSNCMLTIKYDEDVDYDALTSTPHRDSCYDCISPSAYDALYSSSKPGLQLNESNHCLGNYTYDHR